MTTLSFVEITLPQSDRPQVLFLSSYAAINWIINNPYNTELEAVIMNFFAPNSTVSNEGDTFVIKAFDLSRNTNDLTQGQAGIVSMTGREEDYINNDHYAQDFEISGL